MMSDEEHRRHMTLGRALIFGLAIEETSPGVFELFDKDGSLAKLPVECVPRVRSAMEAWAKMLDGIKKIPELNSKLMAENKSIRAKLHRVQNALLDGPTEGK